MVSIKERGVTAGILNDQSHQKVLNFIAEEKVVTLELIIERFPWLRWGDLFSIVGKFRREGLVSIHGVDSHMEIRMKQRPFGCP